MKTWRSLGAGAFVKSSPTLIKHTPLTFWGFMSGTFSVRGRPISCSRAGNRVRASAGGVGCNEGVRGLALEQNVRGGSGRRIRGAGNGVALKSLLLADGYLGIRVYSPSMMCSLIPY